MNKLSQDQIQVLQQNKKNIQIKIAMLKNVGQATVKNWIKANEQEGPLTTPGVLKLIGEVIGE